MGYSDCPPTIYLVNLVTDDAYHPRETFNKARQQLTEFLRYRGKFIGMIDKVPYNWAVISVDDPALPSELKRQDFVHGIVLQNQKTTEDNNLTLG